MFVFCINSNILNSYSAVLQSLLNSTTGLCLLLLAAVKSFAEQSLDVRCLCKSFDQSREFVPECDGHLLLLCQLQTDASGRVDQPGHLLKLGRGGWSKCAQLFLQNVTPLQQNL